MSYARVFSRAVGMPLLLAVAFAFLIASHAQAMVAPESPETPAIINVPATNTPSLHHVAGANGGSRLNSNDSLIICAKDETNANAPGEPPCRTITNRSNKDYFVPWRTPLEWSSFLRAAGEEGEDTRTLENVRSYRAGSACLPKQNTSVCGNINIEQVGSRAAGFIEGDRLNYGAHGDVFGPLYASKVLGDNTINYSVTYVCDMGTWIKSHEAGSCASMDGKCGDNTASGYLSNAQGWPLDTSVLCSAGSILNSLAKVTASDGGSGTVLVGWTWVCSGTPGRQSAACSAPVAISTPGRCSALHGTSADTPPDPATLCAFGTVSASSFSQTSTTWSWTCTGNNPKDPNNVANCSMQNAKPLVNATCGSSANTTIQKLSTPPTNLCSAGSASSSGVSSLVSPDGTTYPSNWTWTCYGKNGGTDTNCKATFNPTANGSCSGTFNNQTFTSMDAGPATNSGAVLPSDNCKYCNKVGNMAACPSPVGLNYNETTSQWGWSCPGDGSGASSMCLARYNPSYTAPSCGNISGRASGVWNAAANVMNLCVDGACGYPNPATVPLLCGAGNHLSSFAHYNYGNYWYWYCQSSDKTRGTTCYASNPNPIVNGTCGAAGGVASATTPADAALCKYGTAGEVVKQGNNYTWTCNGSNGGTSTNCSAAVLLPVNGSCGTVHGTRIPNAPNQNLCFSGVPGDVYGNGLGGGPWSWVCAGTNGGTNAQCSANQCYICSGGYNTPASGTVPVTATHYGCTLSGTLAWQSPTSVLWNTSARSLSGTINGLLGNFSVDKLDLAGAPVTLCPPCFLSPSDAVQGVIKFSGTTGSCSDSETQLVGQEVPVSSLTVK